MKILIIIVIVIFGFTEVSAAVIHFMTNEKPKLRYMVAPNKREAEITIRAAIRRAVELNADQPYEYSREESIAVLDELLTSK